MANNFDSVQINGVTYTAEGSRNKFLRHRGSDSSSSMVPLNKELEKTKKSLIDIQKQISWIEVEQKNSSKLTKEEVENNKRLLSELREKRKELNNQIEIEAELLSKGNAQIKLSQQRLEKSNQINEAKKSELDFENSILKAQQEAIDTELYRYELEEGNWDQRRKNLEDEIELRTLRIMYAETEEEREQAITELLKEQEKLNKHELEHEKEMNEVGMRVKARILAEQKDENPVTKLQDFFSSAKNAFNIGKEEGMSTVSALLNIKEVLISGNENQKKSTEKITSALSSGFNSINSMIDNATNLYSSVYGRVNAAIDGVGKTFDDYVDGMQNLGLSTLVKQADLLQNLSDVASQGIATDLEQIALLSTIKDKTVASFNVTSDGLRRLVRLNQNMGNLTAKQFGLAAVLRTELNQAFGDSSFIGRQFQSLTSTLLDAVTANALKGGTDSTNFYAVMETFAAGMYEAGVDEGTVSAIAQGINYLGSGNVQALSGNKALQNLMLLSLDNAGLDYATILQQGLSTKDTYLLLQSIVDYLADITDTTKKNNVLQSSYANLFNLSITDMSAIRNLSQNSTFQNMALSSVYQTGSWALDQATNEMLAVSEERTTFAEALNNFIDNSKFSLGVGVASSKWAYPLYKLAGLALDTSTLLSNAGLEKTAVVKGLKYAGLGAYGVSLLPGIFNLVTDLGGNLSAIGSDKNTISNYFSANLSNTEGMYSGTATSAALSQATMSNNFKGFNNPYGTEYENKMKSSEVYSESSQWQAEAEAAEQDPNTKILKEFEKTLMKANEGDGYAFAVSLQGMSDGVLRSFASIFADEEAMMETLTGKNNALEENNTFINYVNDSSTKPTSASGSGSTVVK